METVKTLDITDVNKTFLAMLELTGAENAEAKMFGEMFWAEFSDEARTAFHSLWPPYKPRAYSNACRRAEDRCLALNEDF